MNTLEKRDKEIVTEEQIQSARERAGYNSEDLINEVNAVLQKLHEEKHEYLTLSEEQKQKIKEAQDRVVDIDDEDMLEGTIQEEYDKQQAIKDSLVNNPPYYTWLRELCGIDVIDIVRHMDFDLGNATKYILRQGRKKESGMSNKAKAIQDLNKAIWYIKDKIKMLEQE